MVSLPEITDERGSLGFLEKGDHLPFEMKRVYYLYAVPEGKKRGAHGHRELQQLIVPLSGEFEVVLDDGSDRKTFHLSSPAEGLYVSPMMWRDLCNFSHDAVCLVIASEKYDPTDYIHDYQEFVEVAQEQNR